MIVLDASAVLELVAGLRGRDTVADRLAAASSFHAPHLVGIEVLHALRRHAAAGTLGEERAALAVAAMADLGIVHYPHEPFFERIWALRPNLSVYDASYIALAEVLDAPLVTFDARLAASPGHVARVELLAA